MGVGIYKSYAVVWMGQRTDALPAPKKCSGQEAEQIQTAKPAETAEELPWSARAPADFISSLPASSRKMMHRKKQRNTRSLDGSKVSILAE